MFWDRLMRASLSVVNGWSCSSLVTTNRRETHWLPSEWRGMTCPRTGLIPHHSKILRRKTMARRNRCVSVEKCIWSMMSREDTDPISRIDRRSWIERTGHWSRLAIDNDVQTATSEGEMRHSRRRRPSRSLCLSPARPSNNTSFNLDQSTLSHRIDNDILRLI